MKSVNKEITKDKKKVKMRCTICKKIYNPKAKNGNFGWHIDKQGHLVQCSFQNMPMQVLSKPLQLETYRGWT